MIGIIFFVIGLVLFIIGIRLGLTSMVAQTASGKDGSQVTIPTSAKIFHFGAYACWLIAILYGFGILGGSPQPQPMVAGRRRRR